MMARSPQLRDGKRGRCRLVAWPGLVIGQVVKRHEAGRVVGVTRRLAHGTAEGATRLLGGGTIQTASIERLNGTFRARLASLARRTRGLGWTVGRLERGMWLIGTVYNFCTVHASLATGQTPTMAAADALWAGAIIAGVSANCCITGCLPRAGERRRNGEEARKRKRHSCSAGRRDHRSPSTYLLRTAGHQVYTPPLTGLGQCAHLLPRAVGLDTHVQDIVNVLDFEVLSGVILVGHSYAGGVIAGVTERAASRLAHLVYL